MSSWGLEIRNGQGFTSLDPDTFTVKLVETVWLYVAYLREGQVIDIPTSTNVLAGMFFSITVHDNYYLNGTPDLQTDYPLYPLCLPVVEIYNGLVRVKGQNYPDCYSNGYIAITILSYV